MKIQKKNLIVLACFSLSMACSQPVLNENKTVSLPYKIYGICQKCGHLVVTDVISDNPNICPVCKKFDDSLDLGNFLSYTVGK